MKNVSTTAIKKASIDEKPAGILKLAGIVLDAWQVWLLMLMFLRSYLAFSIPRQNGKTFVVIAFCFVMAIMGKRVLYTSHRMEIAAEVGGECIKYAKLKAFKPIYEDSHKSKQYADFTTKNGGKFKACTRTEAAARSETWDIIVYDEAQYLTSEQQSSIQFAAFTSKNLKIIMCGTPLIAEEMQDLENRPFWHAHLQDDFIEWSAGEYSPSIKHTSKKLLKETNPGLSRASEEAVALELKTMGHLQYCQERLGCWLPEPSDEETGEPELTTKQVEKILTKTPAPDGRYDLALAIDDFNSVAVLSVFQANRLEVIKTFDASDTYLIAQWILERDRKINKLHIKFGSRRARADAILDRLEDRKMLKRRVQKVNAQIMTERNRQFLRACEKRKIFIFDDADVRSALRTFWFEETAKGDIYIKGGKPSWEMMIQSLAMHEVHIPDTKPQPKKEAPQKERRSMLFG